MGIIMGTGKLLKHLSTDYDNETFDIGRVMVLFVVASMVFFEGWDVIMHSAKFDAQSFGTGVAALLVGLGAYIFGDKSKNPNLAAPPVGSAYCDQQDDQNSQSAKTIRLLAQRGGRLSQQRATPSDQAK